MTPAEPLSKLRATGYGLIGVGAVAAVLGFTTLGWTGSSDDAAAPQPESGTVVTPDPGTEDSAAPDPGAGEGRPPAPSDSADPDSSTPEPPAPERPSTTRPDEPGSPGTPPGSGDGSGSGTRGSENGISVRILNNSTIHGLAHEAGEDFEAEGYDVAEVGNYARGVVAHTTAYYRPGTAEEQQARRVASDFGIEVEPRIEGLEGSDPGVIVILTKDYRS